MPIYPQPPQDPTAVSNPIKQTASLSPVSSSSQHLEEILDHLPQPICRFLISDGRIVYGNRAFIEYVKMLSRDSPQPQMPYSIYHLLPADQAIQLEFSVHSVKKKRETVVDEVWELSTEEKGICRRWTYIPIFDDQADVKMIQLVGEEIASQVELEKLSQTRESRYRTILEMNPVRMCRFRTSDYKLTFVNPAYCDFWNREENELLGQSMLTLAREEDVPDLKTDVSHIIQHKKRMISEVVRVNQVNSSQQWFQRVYEPILDEEGTVMEIQALYADITKLKETQLALERSEKELNATTKQLQAITSAVPNIIYLFDIKEQKNVYTNKNIFLMLGYEPTEIQAMGSRMLPFLMHADDWETQASHWQTLLNSQQDEFVSREYRLRHKNGRWHWLISHEMVFERDPLGEASLILGVAVDITDSKELEIHNQELNKTLTKINVTLEEKVKERTSSLAAANKKLLQSNAELERFVYIASHDLKEPLRGINTYLNILQEVEEGKLTAEGLGLIDQAERLSLHASNLIEELKNFARIGHDHQKKASIELGIVLDEVLELIEPQLKELQGQAFSLIKQSKLPVVQYPRAHLKTIFQNLISNAVKYNDKAEINIEIGLYQGEVIPAVDGPIIFVKDNGIGIPARHFDRIFEMFKRLHPQRLYGGGTGAGLALVKKIIVANGGQVWLESEINKGTTFYVDLSIDQETYDDYSNE